jgi:hypothetical protein
MIKCEVIENFTLEKFNELKDVQKVIKRKDNEFGVRDTFECEKEMADYLTGNNPLNKTVVKVIEVIPEIKAEIIETAIGKVPNITFEERTKTPKKKKSSKK